MKSKVYKFVIIIILICNNIPLLSLVNIKQNNLDTSQSIPFNVPKIDFSGPNEIPVSDYDLISYNDEKFELNFAVIVETSEIWVDRIYGYLDFKTEDTNLDDSDRFFDGTLVKSYSTGQVPSPDVLNPDQNFMGEDYIKIFENRNTWTRNRKYYNAKSIFPGKIDNEIYFNIKILYHENDDGASVNYKYINYHVYRFYLSDFSTILSLRIVDDDTKAPTILESKVLESKIYDNMDSITINTVASDSSGIDESYVLFQGIEYFDTDSDGLISILNPKVPKQYQYNAIVTDADNDRPGDQLSTAIFNNFQVYDDDINNPVINSINTIKPVIYDGDNEIEFEINVTDSSGISELYLHYDGVNYYDTDGDSRISIPNPKLTRIHYFSVTAKDADDDYSGDSLSTTVYSNFQVYDDDEDPPKISNISLLNAPIYDSSDDIQIQVDVQDISGISEIFIDFLATRYYDDDLDGFLILPNPEIPGTYNFNLTVIDDDNDVASDKQGVTINHIFNIFDDDNEGPIFNNISLVNAPVYDSNETLKFKVDVEDPSGILELYIEFMGKSYYDFDLDGFITISSPKVPGNYNVMIYATDADSEFTNDCLTSSTSYSFTIFDDDTEAPKIKNVKILNFPVLDSSSSIQFYINVSDYSGVSEIFINLLGSLYNDTDLDGFITVLNPIEPGNYSALISIVDNDKDNQNDTLSTSINYSFRVYDDDTEDPEILDLKILNAPIDDSNENVLIEIITSDFSGISSVRIEFQDDYYFDDNMDGIISLPNPKHPGNYPFELKVSDNDNDRPNDQQTKIFVSSFEVYDDDNTPPSINNISILNSPVYDHDQFIDVKIDAEDKPGISELSILFNGTKFIDDNNDFIIQFPSPLKLGNYNFTVYVLDGDNDRIGDALSSLKTSSFNIKDDDISAPMISEIDILNDPIYDSSEFIEIFVEAYDESGLSEFYINFLGQKYYDTNKNNIFRLPNPVTPNLYNFSIFAKDGDSDRYNDELNTIVNSTIRIFDDDITPPQITIYEEIFGWSFFISDQDGYIDSNATGIYTLYNINGTILSKGIIEKEEKIYNVKIPFRPSNYYLEINATNNDLEWDNDEEIIVKSKPKNITLEYCFLFVDQKIETLKDYVDKNLYSILASSIRYKLILAQESLRDAFEEVLDGDLTSSLFKDSMAKVLLKITEFETKFYDKLNMINQEVAENIISDLQDIRDFNVMLMGHSVDYVKNTDIGYEIALVNVDLLNLKDLLYKQSNSFTKLRYLNILISMAICQLETTFFKLSLDMNISCTLSLIQRTLQLAKNETIRLFELELISENLASQIDEIIVQSYNNIQKIKDKL